MLKGDWHVGACYFASLYLAFDGWRSAPVSRWPRVADCLAMNPGKVNVHEVMSGFKAAGLWEEASLLDEPGRVAWAEEQMRLGRVLTVFDGRYPAGWLESLGSGAPPAVWVEGDVPSADLVGVVGSRDLPLEAQFFARELGGYLVSSGRGVVSGGAWGADRLGVAGALRGFGDGAVVEILPCGLEAGERFGSMKAGCYVSIFEPGARFTGAQAMMRNRLIYAWSRRSVVVHARMRTGGTWGGATDALRRGVGRVVVADWGDEASRGLVALGAVRLGMGRGWRSELDFMLRAPLVAAQPDLFGGTVVREKEEKQFGNGVRESGFIYA